MVVAAFGRWHEEHDAARGALASCEVVTAPVAVEAFSVLTRLPSPHRAPAALAREFLAAHFTQAPIVLSPGGYRDLLDEAALANVVGGAVYDALVAATAREAGATLVSLDRRATRLYAAFGTAFRLL